MGPHKRGRIVSRTAAVDDFPVRMLRKRFLSFYYFHLKRAYSPVYIKNNKRCTQHNVHVGYFFSFYFVTTKRKVSQASERETLFTFIFSRARAYNRSHPLSVQRAQKHKWIKYNIIYLYFFSSWQAWLCAMFVDVRNTTIRRILFLPKTKLYLMNTPIGFHHQHYHFFIYNRYYYYILNILCLSI